MSTQLELLLNKELKNQKILKDINFHKGVIECMKYKLEVLSKFNGKTSLKIRKDCDRYHPIYYTYTLEFEDIQLDLNLFLNKNEIALLKEFPIAETSDHMDYIVIDNKELNDLLISKSIYYIKKKIHSSQNEIDKLNKSLKQE